MALRASLFSAALISAGAHADEPDDAFQGLGLLAPTTAFAFGDPFDMSDDGRIIVGRTRNPDAVLGMEAFRWTSETGMVGLGSETSAANGVSGDGLVIVGSGRMIMDNGQINFDQQAFRWTESSGVEFLGDLPGGEVLSTALAASFTGDVIVGFSEGERGIEAVRWVDGGAPEGLGDLPGGNFSSSAADVSFDGARIVGISAGENGQEAFLWTEEAGMVGLGELPGGPFYSEASAISGNGEVIVGSSRSGPVVAGSSSGMEAFRWTEETGMVGLGFLPGGAYSSASKVSRDGSVIVGAAQPGGPELGPGSFRVRAVRWTEQTGLRLVSELLEESGVEIGDWVLLQARSVSGDGRVIAGSGVNPEGVQEAWVANIEVGLLSPDAFAESLEAISLAPWILEDANIRRSESFLFEIGSAGRPPAQNGVLISASATSYSHDTSTGEARTDAVRLRAIGSKQNELVYGVSLSARSDDVSFGESRSELDGASISVDAALAIPDIGAGFELSLVAAADVASYDLSRRYLNGVMPETSIGSFDARALSGALQVSRPMDCGALHLAPFAGVRILHTQLDALEEEGGSFPLSFDAERETLTHRYLGLGARLDLADWMSLRSRLAANFDDDGLRPARVGAIQSLGMDFPIPASRSSRQWADGTISLVLRPSARSEIAVSGFFSDRNATEADGHAGLSLSLASRF